MTVQWGVMLVCTLEATQPLDSIRRYAKEHPCYSPALHTRISPCNGVQTMDGP